LKKPGSNAGLFDSDHGFAPSSFSQSAAADIFGLILSACRKSAMAPLALPGRLQSRAFYLR